MKNYMDFFEQTSKAILFEKFAITDVNGDQIPNLRRYLSEDEVTGDKFHKKILENLAVHSFDEFMEKFCPWIYETIVPGEDGGVEIKYYLEKPDRYDETGLEPTALDATAIYEMVNKLYEQRKNSGKAQIDFDFSEVSKLLSPESQTAKIKQARGDMEAYIQEYYRLENDTPGVPSLEKDNCIKMFNVNRLAVQEAYVKGPAAMLTLKLGDASTALLEMKGSKGSSSSGGGNGEIGIPFYDKEGELRFRVLEKREEGDTPLLENTPNQKMLEILEKDYKKCAHEYMQDSPEITNLVLSNISTELARTKHEEAFWFARLESGQKDYTKWMENLAETVAPLVEKFMGVKAFFENAAVDGKLDSYLLIANATASELVQTDVIKNNLAEFLKDVNRKRETKIWFGIIPGIALGNEKVKLKTSPQIDPNDPFGELENIASDIEEQVNGLVSAEDARILMDICEEAKIMTFYNYKANEKTCFGNINKSIYEQMRDKIDFNSGAYAVCCLPNFTIIPEEETNVIINQELVDKGGQERYVSLKIPAVYVEAAYIAAGMEVGAQQKQLLSKKGFEVDKYLTNIRVDLEDRRVYKKFQSNMCLENILGYPREMDEDIMESRFGFYFSDSKITGERGQFIKHCFVKNARTMRKNGERYVKVSNRLFEDFILMCILDNQNSVDPEEIKRFIRDEIQEWSDYAQSQDNKKKGIINALLKDGEKITTEDNKKIVIDYLDEKGYVEPEIDAK